MSYTSETAIVIFDDANWAGVVGGAQEGIRQAGLEIAVYLSYTWKAFCRVYTLFILGKLNLYKKPKKQLYNGGKTIALLGADGAGKSTMVSELKAWLGYYLDVQTLYGGTGDGKKYLPLALFDTAVGLASSLRGKPPPVQSAASLGSGESRQGGMKVRVKNFRALLIARHRLNTVRDACRLSHNGKIVLLDRFPQPFQRGYGDGPKMIAPDDRAPSRIYNWELAAYERMFEHFPNTCFILMVDPVVSVARKPENDAKVIEEKNVVLNKIAALKDNQSIIIDANLSYNEVLKQMKCYVWSRL